METKQDLQIEIDGLKYEIRIAQRNYKDFSQRHFNKEREKALLFHLKRALDVAKGCELAIETRLLDSTHILVRGLFESLIWVCWISQSIENTRTFIDASSNEMKRVIRKNLNRGFGKVTDVDTGKDKSKELLESEWAKEIHRRISIELDSGENFPEAH